MTPRMRTHVITAALFAAVAVGLGLLWWLRHFFVWALLAVVAALGYYGLYLLVSSRLKARPEEQREVEPPPEREE
jgi:hypothetical protein